MGNGFVVSVNAGDHHDFSKAPKSSIRLLAGIGVEGDAHAGSTVQHRSRVAADPTQPNLRQVHLMHAELHDEMNAAGYVLVPGTLGENITTRGVDLLGLPVGSVLAIGDEVVLGVTGLRNPCRQIDEYAPGLLKLVAYRDTDGLLVRRTGIMSVVIASGQVLPGMQIRVALPPEPHQPLDRV